MLNNPLKKSLTLGTDEVQKLINGEAKEGWRVHTMIAMNFSVIVITFEKKLD
jgi:hypothetical protein